MALDVAMTAAVDAIRRCAGSLGVIARTPGWRVATIVNPRNELVIGVLVPAEREGEWAGERRAAIGELVPRENLPTPASVLADRLEGVARHRGVRGRLQTYLRAGARDVWVFQLVVVAPDDREAKRLRNHDREKEIAMGTFMSGYGTLSEATRSELQSLAGRSDVRFVCDGPKFHFEADERHAQEAFGRALKKHATLFPVLHQEADIFDENSDSDIPF